MKQAKATDKRNIELQTLSSRNSVQDVTTCRTGGGWSAMQQLRDCKRNTVFILCAVATA